MGKVYLVMGGTRSGKSGFAEALVARFGPKVVYVATTRPYGLEAHARIEKHRAQRPAEWTTVEEALDLDVVKKVGQDADVVMLEDLHLWTVNHLVALGDPQEPGWAERLKALEETLVEATRRLVTDAKAGRYRLVMVSSEVGLGVAPDVRRQRAFRDLLGRVNETASSLSDDVFWVVAGCALPIRRLAIRPEDVA